MRWNWGYSMLSIDTILRAIDCYFSIPLSSLQNVVNARNNKNNNHENSSSSNSSPAFAIPEDCFDQHVLDFLTTKHVGLSGLLEDDFDELQEYIFAPTSTKKNTDVK